MMNYGWLERHIISVVLFCIAVSLAAAADDQREAIDTQRSSLTVHVGKAGLLSVAAHEHWANAPITSGSVEDGSATPGVRFTVDARRLSVEPEKGVSDKDQAEVQSNMQSKVLESSTYPEIVFHSTQVRRTSDRVWKVSGDLTLHGATRPVIVDVTREGDAYVGMVRIKQTEFGIQPIKIGGGVVKVKDELEISFHVYTVSR
jgi:polyisoprenoid-binding protein YceI